MDQAYNVLFTIIHLAIIGFNLLGWIWKRTRKFHFIVVCLTAASWFILGIWYGIGYCPITDWHWQIKERMGEQLLPASFIKYLADKISGRNFNAALIDVLTAAGFGFAITMAVYYKFVKTRKSH